MRYRMNLAYDGSAFCGWQAQPNARTVQGCIEEAMRSLLREPSLSIVGCGRTDTAVNASYYVAHFDFDELDCADLRHRLNSILPKEISIFSIEAVKEDFHARFGARRREYRYYIHTAKDSFKRSYSHLYTYDLDIEAMNRAAGMLVGTHDFSCFEKLGADNKTSICTVFQAAWIEYEPEIPGRGSIIVSTFPPTAFFGIWYARLSGLCSIWVVENARRSRFPHCSNRTPAALQASPFPVTPYFFQKWIIKYLL